MNDTDRELTAVKERMMTLEHRIAALEKQLAEVADKPTTDYELRETARKYSLFMLKMSLISLAAFCLLLIVIMLVARAIV